MRCARILDHENKEISDNEDRDQKTIHRRIQSRGGRVGGPWQPVPEVAEELQIGSSILYG